MVDIDLKIVKEAVVNSLIFANTELSNEDYKELTSYNSNIKNEIRKNAYLAKLTKRPLCQDTGLCIFFVEIGQEVHFINGDFEETVNEAVRECYINNFYRKSVVKNAIFNRENTKDNTPCIIHTKITKGDKVKILTAIKGGGAENMTRLKMMNPTSTIEDIIDFVKKTIDEAGENACPPMTIGVGIGGSSEYACLLAKYAIFKGEKLEGDFKNTVNVKMLTAPCHIASLPVCININCHSLRHFEVEIDKNKITYLTKLSNPKDIELNSNHKKINTSNLEEFKKLKKGDKIFLTGKIFTARDMAHKRLSSMIKNNEKLPFEIKNSIIFYAGPCPKKDNEIIGPIGPTTSKRMDKFAPLLYEKGVLATIGKGERTLSGGNRLYFKAIGGIANVYKNCVKSQKPVCFEDLGTEAVVELEVIDMPLEVNVV